ncbi:MAG TPA: glycosyltransferase family 2 protein [Dehalococcoidia bacterium]|nr:glycosyltransferase family 2 protein [Dehalococcoidia bacterium]
MTRPRAATDANDEPPHVSVLLAVRNDVIYLKRCLAALKEQDYPAGRLEVVIADGRSTDGTGTVIQDFSHRVPFRVEAVDNPSGGAATGFNAALRVARGTIIVLLGARALPAADFVSAGVRTLEETGADAAGGVVAGEASGIQAEAVALALGSRFGVGDAHYRYASESGEVDTVNYGAYRREVFEELGGFDETMDNVEDDEFNYRLREAGKRLYLSPSISCQYSVRPSLIALARQYGRYGYPKVRVLLRHPRQMRPRQFAPAALVGGLALTLIASARFGFVRRFFWLVAGLYAVATAIASGRIARRSGWRYLPLLAAAFAGMHLSYGAASLLGALRFGLLPALLNRPDRSAIPRDLARPGVSIGNGSKAGR